MEGKSPAWAGLLFGSHMAKPKVDAGNHCFRSTTQTLALHKILVFDRAVQAQALAPRSAVMQRGLHAAIDPETLLKDLRAGLGPWRGNELR
jgi:hypothetical protein